MVNTPKICKQNLKYETEVVEVATWSGSEKQTKILKKFVKGFIFRNVGDYWHSCLEILTSLKILLLLEVVEIYNKTLSQIELVSHE